MKENSGLAIAIAAGAIFCFAVFPAVIVVLVYLFGTVYAIAKAIGVGGRSPNPGTVLIGVVLLVSTLVTLLYVGIAVIGRAMDPKKRAERDAA